MSPWKSRWSWLRLVKAPTAKEVPLTRPRDSACEDTSIATTLTPRSSHHREQRLQVGGFRGGQRAGRHLAVDPGLHGADQAGLRPVGGQRGLQQVAGGGLAGCSGDADHRQPAARVAVDRPGDGAEQRPRGLGDQHRDGNRQVAEAVRRRRPGRSARRPHRRSTASPANCAPCILLPGSAANRSPGRTSWARRVTPVSTMSAAGIRLSGPARPTGRRSAR